MAYSAPKLAVRDSFDDEDVSDDMEDEVFIRDGRNGFKLDEERGVKRPLMAPRRKLKSNHFHNDVCKNSTYKVLCIPCCYGFFALTALLGLIALVVLLIMWFPIPLDQLAFWRSRPIPTMLLPCTEITTEDVWIQTYPKLTSEASVQINDINGDGIFDVIIGYGTGADREDVPEVVCTVYFDQGPPCGGGILALDGRSGHTLWQHWTSHTVYWVDCGADLTADSVQDCLISGRGGVLEAVNGHDGSNIWQLEIPATTPPGEGHPFQVNAYAGRFVQDLDGDGVQDILAAHTEENTSSDTGAALCGHLMIVSGRTGHLLRQISTPQGEESYYPPQVLVRIDGQLVAVWGTGGVNTAGGLYVLPMLPLAAGDISQQEALYWDKFKGVMSPPALVDVNDDGLEDIIVATFNSSVLAFDGHTYNLLWNFSFIGSESSSTPIPGYFDEDDIPDLLVKYQTGPGSPIYYYSQTTVLDGRTGKSLLDEVLIDTAGRQPGGLTVSVEGFGNDLFLHWSADCLGHEGSRDPYSFLPGESLDAQSRADICKLRFNSTLVTRLLAFSEHLEPPGITVYSSEDRTLIEFQDAVNSTEELQKYLQQHPDFWENYVGEKQTKQPSVDFPAVNGMRANQDGSSNFRHKEDSILGEEEHKERGYYYSGRDYTVPNRGRNREPGGRTYPTAGEDEEALPAYAANSEYPDVRKHGVDFSNHPAATAQWRHQWRTANARPAEDPPEGVPLGNYQDLTAGRLFESPVPMQDTDFDMSGLYYPPSDEGYPPLSQRDERTPEGSPDTSHGRRLRGDRRGQSERKRRSTEETPLAGVQKLTSAGVLIPSFSNVHNDSIDIVFATYWIPPSNNVHLLLHKHLQCIEKKISHAATLNGRPCIVCAEKSSAVDQATIQRTIAQECLKLKLPVDTAPKDTDAEMDLLDVSMGQMTVYRLRLSCRCKSLTAEERCSTILPFEQQSWPTVGGTGGNGYFKPKRG